MEMHTKDKQISNSTLSRKGYEQNPSFDEEMMVVFYVVGLIM